MFSLFRRTLPESVARYYANTQRELLYPEVVWGLVQDYTSGRGKVFRGIARVGMQATPFRGPEIWQSRKHADAAAAEGELLSGLEEAAQVFPLAFELLERVPGDGHSYLVRRRIEGQTADVPDLP